jgi:hypothetical protein
MSRKHVDGIRGNGQEKDQVARRYEIGAGSSGQDDHYGPGNRNCDGNGLADRRIFLQDQRRQQHDYDGLHGEDRRSL